MDTSRTSEELFDGDGDSQWRRELRERDIALDEIAELLGKHYPGQTAEAKKIKGDLIEQYAATRSWERVKALRPAEVKDIRDRLWLAVEGVAYTFVPPRPVLSRVEGPRGLPPYTSTTGQAVPAVTAEAAELARADWDVANFAPPEAVAS